MALLPTTTGTSQNCISSRTSQSVTNRLPVIFRRLLKFHQMVLWLLDFCFLADEAVWQDFELAALQLTYLCIAPKRVYVCLGLCYVPSCADFLKGIGMFTSINVCIISVAALFYTTHVHKETKNTWARDDPAILILIAGGMLGDSPTLTVVHQHLT